MSYINDALRRVQKEKESRYTAYENIVSAPVKKLDRSKKWLPLIGILAVFFFAAAMVIFLYGTGNKKAPAKRISAPRAASPVLGVVPAKPQVVSETIADKQDQTGLKKETASPEIKVKPGNTDPKIIYKQALQRQHEGKLNEAKNLYREVLKIDPQNVQALNNLGVIYMSQKRYKMAIMRFKDAIKIKHDYSDAHYNMACVYAKRNNTDRSLLYLKKAVAFNPEVIKWAKDDGDLQALADLPEFKKLLERP